MAVIKFDDYEVNSLKYERNSNYDDKSNISSFKYKPEFEVTSGVNEEEHKATVRLVFKTPADFPFHVEADISGHFTYNPDEDEAQIGFKRLLNVNGSAIMFPYLRALVSQITGMSNEFPSLILPTINLAAYFDQQEKKTDNTEQ
ncbi:MAG: protein-export chaperone SecB [Schleiferilactobacillus perolens]|uniref:protein-export chaperone SecB n=1 Tax=Schleiferilactobacillus perolens TaxID=100468 RepID=UPI0039E817ED